METDCLLYFALAERRPGAPTCPLWAGVRYGRCDIRKKVWTKPGLLGPDRGLSLEPGGVPGQRRTLPAEWFTHHSFHKHPLSTHCMPSTGHTLPWSEAGTHPAGHPVENTGSLAPEVPARRGPGVSTHCSEGHGEGPEFLEQRGWAYDEACCGGGAAFLV